MPNIFVQIKAELKKIRKKLTNAGENPRFMIMF